MDLVNRGKVDVIASHFALYAFPFSRDLSRLPWVVHFHGPWAQEARVEGSGRAATALRWLIESAVYRRAKLFIVHTDAFGKILTHQYKVAAERVRYVPGGVNVKHFCTGVSRAEARRMLGWPADRPIVLAVRRLASRMGLESLIASVDYLRRQVPDALVLIGGKGKLATALTDQISSLGLQDHVRLLGFISDENLPLAYRAADVSVVPTVALEGFGLVAAESLAAGTPPLVTPVGGLPEVVRGLSDDLVLADTTPEALAEGLSKALRGDMALPSASECRQHATSRFDWSILSVAIRDVYEEACS